MKQLKKIKMKKLTTLNDWLGRKKKIEQAEKKINHRLDKPIKLSETLTAIPVLESAFTLMEEAGLWRITIGTKLAKRQVYKTKIDALEAIDKTDTELITSLIFASLEAMEIKKKADKNKTNTEEQ